jgi:hypothetical protein
MVMDDPEYCQICAAPLTWEHDHKPDFTGLDDGPYLPGMAPRKKAAPKPAEEVRAIRLRAWETRRNRYGAYGHR